jgi:hypothetical protein
MKKSLLIALVVFLSIISLLFLAFNHRTISSEASDPTGQYVAKLSYRTFYSFIPMSPGSSSDKPGFVEIFNKNGESMGRVPVPSLQLGGVLWKPDGADVQMIGEWNFKNGSCYYWDESGSKKIFVKGKPLNSNK